jgi:hypothetical protein
MRQHTDMQPHTDMQQHTELSDRSVGDLVRLANEQFVALVRHEVDFAKAEMTQKAKRAGVGAGLFGTAGVLALYALGVFIAAAILGLALVLPGWAAALVVGGGLILIAGLAAVIGRSRLRGATPAVPQESVRSLREDLSAVTSAAKPRSRA